jgi:hypothetical protein
MKPLPLVAILLTVMLPALLEGQYRGRRMGGPSATVTNAPALKGLIVTFHGVLKKMSKKEILIQSDDNKLVTIRRQKTTKFLDKDQEIKATDIDLETPISVDASEDLDLKLMAVNVKVDSQPKKTLEK